MFVGQETAPEIRATRLALSLLAEPGDPTVARDVQVRGPVRVLEDWGQEKATPGQGAPTRRSGDPAATMRRVETLLKSCGPELRWVCPGDAEWPQRLDDLDHVEAVQRRGGPPLGLWVRGAHRLDDAARRSVAVVGSRTATTYGTQMAGDLAAECAERGIGVVSGAAYGIDASAHRGAMAGEGLTIAVLACGVDVPYPRGHESLLRRIGQDGLVVSELAPGVGVTRLRFLSRNRLIAALSGGTVVVEAAARSGSLNTANWAGRLGRVVMGVPGPVTSSSSFGVHRLIRESAAELVTNGAEVAESLAPLGSETCAWVEGEQRVVDALSDVDRVVLDALPVRPGASAVDVAGLAHVDTDAAASALGRLLLAGLAERDGEGWRLARDALSVLRAR